MRTSETTIAPRGPGLERTNAVPALFFPLLKPHSSIVGAIVLVSRDAALPYPHRLPTTVSFKAADHSGEMKHITFGLDTSGSAQMLHHSLEFAGHVLSDFIS